MITMPMNGHMATIARVSETMEENQFAAGVRYAIEYLSELYGEGIYKSDLVAEYMPDDYTGEGE
jgi:hypothetical protein